MKLVRYLKKQANQKRESYGILKTDNIVDVPNLAKSFGKEFPAQLACFINENTCVATADKLTRDASQKEIAKASTPTNKVTILAPIGFPPKIVCLGLNYRDHASEQNAAIPDEPIIFMKPRTAIISPNESIVKPTFVKQLDYEAELAIIIGKTAKNIPATQAESYIFGYTILNDVSARDIQFKDKQWTRAKSFDTFAPLGPCITTTNQLKDTSNLAIHTWVNNELRQNSTTKNMIFNVPEIIHQLSRVMTLEPCDIIATGTPAGVGFAMKPHPKFLQAGDKIRIEIEGIGILENTVSE
jgi:2-keto-4-pentenoate hydratase/2-oxohepta-3-ene-1,7-dioic acid hydratase in catechol pathway